MAGTQRSVLDLDQGCLGRSARCLPLALRLGHRGVCDKYAVSKREIFSDIQRTSCTNTDPSYLARRSATLLGRKSIAWLKREARTMLSTIHHVLPTDISL